MKTVRFTQVVKRCGAPEIYLAWVDPKKDKLLKRALVENRVMTLHQELHGGKKDFGTVGYMKDRHAQILLFPKSLRRFTDRRIIAIDYSLFVKDGTTNAPSSPKDKDRLQAENQSSKNVSDGRAGTRSTTRVPMAKRATSKKTPTTKRIRANAAPPAAVSDILTEVKRAVDELAAGKSVPAYERLRRLIDSSG
jgi:hypothetical protein